MISAVTNETLTIITYWLWFWFPFNRPTKASFSNTDLQFKAVLDQPKQKRCLLCFSWLSTQPTCSFQIPSMYSNHPYWANQRIGNSNLKILEFRWCPGLGCSWTLNATHVIYWKRDLIILTQTLEKGILFWIICYSNRNQVKSDLGLSPSAKCFETNQSVMNVTPNYPCFLRISWSHKRVIYLTLLELMDQHNFQFIEFQCLLFPIVLFFLTLS